ncbi:MAG: hypothetical protein AAGA48_25835 [Myxococcota bacterium]
MSDSFGLLFALLIFAACAGAGICVGVGLLILGVVLLRRTGDDVTVRKAVEVGARSVSQAFVRGPGGLVPLHGSDDHDDDDDDDDAIGKTEVVPMARAAAEAPDADEEDLAETQGVVTYDETRMMASAEVVIDDDDDDQDEPEVEEMEEASTEGHVEAPTEFAPRRRKLKRAGFFAELPHGDEDGPSLGDARNETPQPHEARIVAYLREAPVLIEESDNVADVLDPSGEWIGPASIHTDGVWAWPADLAYYVEHYHVNLPTSFVEHLVDRGYALGEIDLEAIEF